jgi:hypothetical protein
MTQPRGHCPPGVSCLNELDQGLRSETGYIDLAETTEFRPSTTEGECAV